MSLEINGNVIKQVTSTISITAEDLWSDDLESFMIASTKNPTGSCICNSYSGPIVDSNPIRVNYNSDGIKITGEISMQYTQSGPTLYLSFTAKNFIIEGSRPPANDLNRFQVATLSRNSSSYDVSFYVSLNKNLKIINLYFQIPDALSPSTDSNSSNFGITGIKSGTLFKNNVTVNGNTTIHGRIYVEEL